MKPTKELEEEANGLADFTSHTIAIQWRQRCLSVEWMDSSEADEATVSGDMVIGCVLVLVEDSTDP